MRKLKDKINDLQHAVGSLKVEIKSLNDQLEKLQVITDYATKDVVCPICGYKMTVSVRKQWFSGRIIELSCPCDNFTVKGESLKECVSKLSGIEVTSND